MKKYLCTTSLMLLLFILNIYGQACDFFNIANTSTIPNWTEQVGDWEINNNRIQSPNTANWNIVTYNGSTQTNGCVTARAIHNGNSQLQFMGVVGRYQNSSTYIMAKIQCGLPGNRWNSCYIYSNGTNALTITNMNFGTDAIIQMEYNNAMVYFRIDTNRNGTWDYTYSATVSNTGSGLCGLGAYNRCYADDWCYGPSCTGCGNITIIPGCGSSNTITSTHSGSGMGWNVNLCGYNTPGEEKLYSFTPLYTGNYKIVVTDAAGGYIDYFYKPAAMGCDPNNWTCIGDIYTTGTYGNFLLNAGTTYYFLLDPEGTSNRSQTFYIECAPPCNNITNISNCGPSYAVTSSHNGTGSNWNINSCGYATPGEEKIYSFTPSVTGNYRIVVTNTSENYYIDYFFKPASLGCDPNNWTCIQNVAIPTETGSFTLNAGTTYYFLLDAEGTNPVSHTFYIDCPSPCTSPIITIPDCGPSNTITSNHNDYGFSWVINTCGFNTYGEEKIYKFTPTKTGIYNIVVTSATGGYIDYFYKPASQGCNQNDWICIDDINSAGTYGSFNLQAWVTYYFLLDAETPFSSSQTFYISCPPPMTCPTNITDYENEPDCYNNYVDNSNGGCNSTPNVFHDLKYCSGTVCGKSGNYLFGGSNYRDTDWYRLTVQSNTTIKMKAVGDFLTRIFLIDITAGCGSINQLATTSAYAGDTAILEANFGPGTIAFWIGPENFTGNPCGLNYFFTYEVGGNTLPPAPTIADIPTCAPTQLLPIPSTASTNYYWQGTSCDTTITNPANVAYPVNTSGTYYVAGKNNSLGCWTRCNSVDVEITPPPQGLTAYANGNADGDTICPSDSVFLTADCSLSTDIVYYRWLKGTQVLQDWSTNPDYLLSTPESYEYTVEAKYLKKPKVLICHADKLNVAAQLKNYLSGFSDIEIVDTLCARFHTPTLAKLQNYDIVITWSNYLYANATLFGNILKQYIDGGGRLITLFAATDTFWGILGDYLSNNYSPIQQTNQFDNIITSIGNVALPSHPLMDGITDINPSYHQTTSNLTANSQAVFYWATGSIGCAFKEFASEGKIVAINLFPESASGAHKLLIIYNAVKWLKKFSLCKVTDNVPVNIIPLPNAAGTITGATSVCQGDVNVNYSVPVINNAYNYVWAYTGNGATINGTTNTITVSFANNATSGNLIVYGSNTCGNGTPSSLPITVNPCSGIQEISDGFTFNLYPNPNNGTFVVDLTSNSEQQIHLSIINFIGQTMFTQQFSIKEGKNTLEMNFMQYPSGIYYLKIDGIKGVVKKTFVIQQ